MTSPRLIVEVRWGKLAGTKLVLRSGQKARVGRSPRADLALEHDGRMSLDHFDLSWDGARARLLNLCPRAGTLLHGARIDGDAEIAHGGWVQAGDTHFMVYVEGKTPPARDAHGAGSVAAEIEEQRRHAAERALAAMRPVASDERLYAVLDAARDDRVLEICRQHVEPHRSLFDGAKGEALEEVAPYLAGPMRADSRLLESLVLEGWGKRWGIWCTSDEPFGELRRHFRRFLMVELEPSGKKVFFRFYDPAVMQAVWRTSSPPQRAQLFGRARSLHLEHAGLGITSLRSSADVPS